MSVLDSHGIGNEHVAVELLLVEAKSDKPVNDKFHVQHAEWLGRK
jgi:hypothetical protein